MDSSHLRSKVQDIAKSLITVKNQYGPTIDEYFADDAYYLSPIHVTKGKKNIENVFALHQVFRTDAKLTDVQWNEQNKTATFTVKGRYHLPVAELPWPVKELAKYDVPLDVKDIQLQVEPDHSAPAPSPSEQGDVDDTKYHVTKFIIPSPTPKNGVLALAFNIISLGLRWISPVVMVVLGVVVSFFQRHPLSQGIIRCAFAAAYEFAVGVLNFAAENAPILGARLKSIRAKADAAFAETKAAPNVDSAPNSPAPVEKRKPRQSARHPPAGLLEDDVQRPAALIEDRPSSASPGFKGGKSGIAKGAADPPAVVFDEALGSSANNKNKKPAARKPIPEELVPAGLIVDEPAPAGLIADDGGAPAGLIEDESVPLIKDAPVAGLVTDGPDSVSAPLSRSATATDTDSGDATSPSPTPHANLHPSQSQQSSDGHAPASKNKKGNKKKRNQKQQNSHSSHNQQAAKKAEAQH